MIWKPFRKRSTIQNKKKNCGPVIMYWCDLSSRKEVTECSISAFQPAQFPGFCEIGLRVHKARTCSHSQPRIRNCFEKKLKIDAEYNFLVINVNTVLKKSKFVWVAVDKNNLDQRLQKMDVTDICNRGRANAKGRIHKLTQLNVTLPYTKMHPWVANTLNYQDCSGENPCVNCLTFRRSCRKP